MTFRESITTIILQPYMLFKGVILFLRGALSEQDGSPSASRLIMFLFSLAVVRSLFIVVRHIVALTDTTLLTIWLANLPVLIGALIGLITAPYLVNKGSAGISDVASLITNLKDKK